MSVRTNLVAPRPPLQLSWRSGVSLLTAVAGNNSIYGITPDGYLVACTEAHGNARWISSSQYLTQCLAISGESLYAYSPGVGLMGIADLGSSCTEQTLFVIPQMDASTVVSQPVRLGSRVHFVLGNSLVAVDAAGGGKLDEAILNAEGPHTLYTYDGDLLVISGAGRPSRWHPGTGGYSLVWDTGLTGSGDLVQRPALIAGSRLFVGEPAGVSAYDLVNGHRIWSQPAVGNLALAATASTLYVGGERAGTWALDLATGEIKWDRQHLAFVSHTPQVALAAGEEHLWVGALLENGYEPAALWAINLSDGAFAWQATGVSLPYANGLPLISNGQIFTYGTSDPVGCMATLAGTPQVTLAHIKQAPNPLRGPMAGYNPVEVSVQLSVPASISFIAWHERDERNNPIGPIPFAPGSHLINYNAQWPRGWTDINQFGRLAFDIEESVTGLKYSQTLLVPVNTLPDIQHHWGKQPIEVMLYNKFIGGYPDLTFLPDNLITRAETSTIIARTLNLQKPSPNFHTKFTDIAGHWAANAIMAMEERGIIGGFAEENGTFTFRPDNDITRAQEASILVKAYEVPPAPAGFGTRFSDIAGHWAEPVIKALESKGYVTGFREPDGTYTYRPEQNLTRAELCALVVRIRRLTR